MEFSSQEYWSGLPFLSPGDLPYLTLVPALWADSLLSDPQGEILFNEIIARQGVRNDRNQKAVNVQNKVIDKVKVKSLSPV